MNAVMITLRAISRYGHSRTKAAAAINVSVTASSIQTFLGM